MKHISPEEYMDMPKVAPCPECGAIEGDCELPENRRRLQRRRHAEAWQSAADDPEGFWSSLTPAQQARDGEGVPVTCREDRQDALAPVLNQRVAHGVVRRSTVAHLDEG